PRAREARDQGVPSRARLAARRGDEALGRLGSPPPPRRPERPPPRQGRRDRPLEGGRAALSRPGDRRPHALGSRARTGGRATALAGLVRRLPDRTTRSALREPPRSRSIARDVPRVRSANPRPTRRVA